jgi:hypothetical protein
MAYDNIPGVDENFLFPHEVLKALVESDEMDTFAGIIKAAYGKAITDNNKLVYPMGDTLPTSTEAKVIGRLFYKTDEMQLYVYTGAVWAPVGGRVNITPAAFMNLASGYSLINNASSTPYIYRTGKRMDFKLRIQRNAPLSHGGVIATIRSPYTPLGTGAVAIPALQSGGNASASTVGCGILGQNATIVTYGTDRTSDVIELAGAYFTV